jgi:hypothetical protein
MIGFSFMHYDDVWDKKIRIFDLECKEMTELELYEAAALIDKNRNSLFIGTVQCSALFF